MNLRLFILFFFIGAFNISLNAQSVTITSSASGAICAGTNVTFTAVASNILTPTYQWFKNSVAINGATSSTYSTTSLTTNDQVYVKANTISAGSILSSGLLFNLDAGISTSYSGSGSTWNDISGNNNNTTLSNSPTYSSANGGSLVFNGTNQYGETPNIITGFSKGTFIAWIKRNGSQGPNTSGYVAIIYSRTGNPVGLNIVDNYLSITWGDVDYKFTLEGLLIPDNTWCMVALSVSASPKQTTAYLFQPSGLTTASISPTINPTTVKFKIGVDDCCARYFNGNIGQALTYNTALNSAEIQSIYNFSASRFGLTPIGKTYTSNSITVSLTSSPSTPIITTNGDACVNKTSLTTPSGLTSYAWYKDNIAISSAITNSYIPTSSGAYQVTVSNGTCSSTSIATIIYTCGNNADGKAVPTTNAVSIISNEGGANFGTGKDISGKLFNTTGITSIFGTIGSSTAVIGGVISPTNIITTSIGAIYSTDVNFGTYSTTTIQSNVAAGSYSSNISGLNPLTTYFAKSFIVNKAGTSYGPVVSFATLSPPPVLGGSYGGGTVVHIFKNGDPGYVIGETHGIIMSNEFLNNSQPTVWTSEATTIATNATGTVLGSGLTNSNSIYNLIGNAAIAINLCRNYSVTISGTTYTNWYLPSIGEWNQVFTNFYNGLLPNFNPNSDSRVSNAQYAWTSSEVSASDVTLINIQNAGSFPIIKKWIGGTGLVRAIRYF